MNAVSKSSNAASTTRAAYTIIGIALILALALYSAGRFPKAYKSAEKLLDFFMSGAQTPLIFITTLLMGAFATAAIAKLIMFFAQYVVFFTVDSKEKLEAYLHNNASPPHMQLRLIAADADQQNKIEVNLPVTINFAEQPRFYYVWKWEHSIFLSMAAIIAFRLVLSGSFFE